MELGGAGVLFGEGSWRRDGCWEMFDDKGGVLM